MPNILEMTGIEKRFGPVIALDRVDFDLRRGEVHALLGVNGAGKSTLIKILSGHYTADRGSITIDSRPCEIKSPRDAIAAGIAAVQQHPELVDDFTAFENIFLGLETTNRSLFKPVSRKALRRRAADLLTQVPLDIDLDKTVKDMTRVDREIVAVLRSIAQRDVKILILDDPTSTLTRVEKQQLFKMMNTLRSSGVSIIYITHRLEEVFEAADRFTVFRGGRKIATMTPTEAKQQLISLERLMLQDEVGELYPMKNSAESTFPPILVVQNLCHPGAFENITFSARREEVLGIYGLVGSGIDELAKALFGAIKPASGDILVRGLKVDFNSPRDALKCGIYLVPGDRRTEGLVLTDNVIFNTVLARLERASTFGGLLRFAGNSAAAKTLASQVDLQPLTLRRPAGNFSGGNQQKIVIAKGLFTQAGIYLFVEPTVGVDIGARRRLYKLIRELSKTAAVVVLSSDCDEVYGLSDRVTALFKGRMVSAPSATMRRDELLRGGIMGTAA